jgi:hypothetical protein
VTYRRHGAWININHGQFTGTAWPASTAVSTSSLVVSAEQSGHFTSVRGTNQIVGGTNGELSATTSPQTAQVPCERDQESDR